MEKKIESGWLLDFYGPLLTEARLEVLRLYCEEDLSISEIAEQMRISRQGVYDAIRRGEAQLEAYEEKLGLMSRYRSLKRAVEKCRSALNEGGERAIEAARDALEEIEWIER